MWLVYMFTDNALDTTRKQQLLPRQKLAHISIYNKPNKLHTCDHMCLGGQIGRAVCFELGVAQMQLQVVLFKGALLQRHVRQRQSEGGMVRGCKA